MTKQSIFAKVILHRSNCYGFWHGVWVIYMSTTFITPTTNAGRFYYFVKIMKKNIFKCEMFAI